MGETSNANLLTTGSIPKKIIMFAIPLLWGNLFQQLYNVADSLIVGNFLGNNALAAVSIWSFQCNGNFLHEKRYRVNAVFSV